MAAAAGMPHTRWSMSHFENVRVWRSETYGPYPAIRHGNVVAYEFVVEPRWTRSGEPEIQRSFLLLDEGVDMAQPVGFQEAQADWWYVDLVRSDVEGLDIRRRDMWIDIIVGSPDQPYSIRDLEEFGDAMRDGNISLDEAVAVLHDCQRFIDRRLTRHRDPLSTSWPDFPPTELAPVLTAPIAPLASI